MAKEQPLRRILVKGNIQRPFSERAAKIAIEHLGWIELEPLIRPAEIGTKTRPPEISRPIKLVEPPVITKVDVTEQPEYNEVTPEVEKIKKTRRPRKK